MDSISVNWEGSKSAVTEALFAATGDPDVTLEGIKKISELVNSQATSTAGLSDLSISNVETSDYYTHCAPSVGTSETRISGTMSSSEGVYYGDEFAIKEIIRIRDKLDEFLDGSNILIKVMNPQTVREMVREMRHEIRKLKKEHGISELEVINFLEEEINNESRYQARNPYDRSELPF